MMRDYDQGNLSKKAFNWGFDYSFRDWVDDHYAGSVAASKQAWNWNSTWEPT